MFFAKPRLAISLVQWTQPKKHTRPLKGTRFGQMLVWKVI